MPHDLIRFAQEMRLQPTPPERVLWQALRAGQLNGLKFRRQAILGPYIADFYCPPARLVVEVDGLTHIDPAIDQKRTNWLLSQNIRVLRFWNNDVMTNLPGILALIAKAARTPPPSPPTRGGGKKGSSTN
jgi:very-short-patch-repair endonuclease